MTDQIESRARVIRNALDRTVRAINRIQASIPASKDSEWTDVLRGADDQTREATLILLRVCQSIAQYELQLRTDTDTEGI